MALRLVLFICVGFVLLVSSSAAVFELKVGKKLNDGVPIDDAIAPVIRITPTCTSDEIGNIQIEITSPEQPEAIPTTSTDQDLRVYFANDTKSIVTVSMKRDGTSSVELQELPYSVDNVVLGEVPNYVVTTANGYWLSTVSLTADWLPEHVSRISASLQFTNNNGDTELYNYYGLKNYQISLPDLIVVDNFKKFDCSKL